MTRKTITRMLTDNGLKITPQRIAVIEAVENIKDHPTAERILEYIQMKNPNIAVGTVYKILETFTEKGIIRKVKTDSDKMRYDAVRERHHHIYCSDSEHIEDYYDEELNTIIDNYIDRINIPGFSVEDIKLQIIGRFVGGKKVR